MSTQLFAGLRGKISRRDVEYRFATMVTLGGKTSNGASIASQYASGELGVGLKVKRILDLAVLVTSSLTSADNHTAVRQPSMVAVELLLANEVHGYVVFVKVVRHFYNLLGYLSRVSAFFQNNPALARMLFTRGELGVGA